MRKIVITGLILLMLTGCATSDIAEDPLHRTNQITEFSWLGFDWNKTANNSRDGHLRVSLSFPENELVKLVSFRIVCLDPGRSADNQSQWHWNPYLRSSNIVMFERGHQVSHPKDGGYFFLTGAKSYDIYLAEQNVKFKKGRAVTIEIKYTNQTGEQTAVSSLEIK